MISNEIIKFWPSSFSRAYRNWWKKLQLCSTRLFPSFSLTLNHFFDVISSAKFFWSSLCSWQNWNWSCHAIAFSFRLVLNVPNLYSYELTERWMECRINYEFHTDESYVKIPMKQSNLNLHRKKYLKFRFGRKIQLLHWNFNVINLYEFILNFKCEFNLKIRSYVSSASLADWTIVQLGAKNCKDSNSSTYAAGLFSVYF